MAVDDLWYLRKPGPDGERVKSKRHGRGKRYRVRYRDAHGAARERLFDLKRDADAWDARARSGSLDVAATAVAQRQTTFTEYSTRWRLSREAGWAVETRRRVEANLRLHLVPVFGAQPIRSITLTAVLEWLSEQLAAGTPQGTLKLYFELLSSVLGAAVTDRIAADNPCDRVRLSRLLRGISRVPKWVPTEAEVSRLMDAVPGRHRAALWLGAGQGCRLAEVLGMEEGSRCFDVAAGELHVLQQLRYSPSTYGGFYLSEPKSGSSGTVELDPMVAQVVDEHVRAYPSVPVELVDITSGVPARRTVPLLFTTAHGNPFTDKTWSREWAKWRAKAGWPVEHGTFHALRHFFATTLISNHAEPQEVQRALRHKTLRVTLETYVHWWPKRERRRGVVGELLQAATGWTPAR